MYNEEEYKGIGVSTPRRATITDMLEEEAKMVEELNHLISALSEKLEPIKDESGTVVGGSYNSEKDPKPSFIKIHGRISFILEQTRKAGARVSSLIEEIRL